MYTALPLSSSSSPTPPPPPPLPLRHCLVPHLSSRRRILPDPRLLGVQRAIQHAKAHAAAGLAARLAVALVKLANGPQRRHVLADAGRELAQRLVEVGAGEDAAGGEGV